MSIESDEKLGDGGITSLDEPDVEGTTTSFIPGLFNTLLFENISPNFMADVTSQRRHIDSGALLYGDGKKQPKDLPRTFNTLEISGFPVEDIPKWFYRDAAQQYQPISLIHISEP